MGTGRSAPQSIRPGSIRPTSAPNAVVPPKLRDDPPQVLGRSAPTLHMQWRRQGGASQGTCPGCKVLFSVQMAR